MPSLGLPTGYDSFLIYMDDSGDTKWQVYGTIIIPMSRWHEGLETLKGKRREFRDEFSLFIRKELHASDFVAGRGRAGSTTISMYDRSRIFRRLIESIHELPEARVCTSILPAKNKQWALERLLNRCEKALRARQAHGVLISDAGNEGDIRALMRRMRRSNQIPSRSGAWGSTKSATKNIPITQLIEDPVFRDSSESYFIQLADFLAFSLFRREHPTPKLCRYEYQTFFDLVAPLHLPANRSDPDGVIRL